MKVLSNPDGDGLLTNAEVMAWLQDKQFDLPKNKQPKNVLRQPRRTVDIAKSVKKYIELSPAGPTDVISVQNMFTALEKFNLSSTELLMIANIKPEAYAQLTPLIVDVHTRYDENQLYEILEIAGQTLKQQDDVQKQKDVPQEEGETRDVEMEPMQDVLQEATPATVLATALDITSAPAAEILPLTTSEAVPATAQATALDITTTATADIILPTTSEAVPATAQATALDITTTAPPEILATVPVPPNAPINGVEEDQQYKGGVRATILDYSSRPDSNEAVKNEPEEQ